ncbi:MAG: hypothetical protein AMXMBFR57_08550 [Acidimicrobiia bacterium]
MADPQGAGGACDRARQWMGFVRHLVSRGGRREIDPYVAVTQLDVVSGHAVGLVAGFAFPGPAVKLPAVPRARHVVAVQPPIAQRAADVIAHA